MMHNMGEIAVAEHQCGQDPWELSALLDVVGRVIRPRLLLEIGSWYAGSLFAWRSLGIDVLAVTLPDTREFINSVGAHGAEMIYGNSHDEEMYGRITEAAGPRPIDFAFIDGDHSEEGCRADLDLCLRLKVPVIGIHDVSAAGDPGVRKVWADACDAWPHLLIEKPRADPRPIGAGIIWPG